jgi:hypothetical protein
MPEEVDPHVQRKYELVERLGKGVRPALTSSPQPCLVRVHCSWLQCVRTQTQAAPVSARLEGGYTGPQGAGTMALSGLSQVAVLCAGVWRGVEGCGEGNWSDHSAQEDLRRLPECH